MKNTHQHTVKKRQAASVWKTQTKLSIEPLWQPIGSLLLASVLCGALVFTRIIQMDSLHFGFLLWNLFLAWIPLVFAFMLYKQQTSNWLQKITFGSLFCLWLLFFPNAPYIVSDLIHLRWNTAYLIWFDAVLVFGFAFTGLQVGLYSLYLVQLAIQRSFNRLVSWLTIAGSIWLSGLGIYMGRELRFNSWELFTNPLDLLTDTWSQLDIQAMQMTVLYAALIGVVYLIFRSLADLKLPSPTNT